MRYDAIVVGGGPAGLSAALLLGRSRRAVLVCDNGEARNAVSHASHSFFTQDGHFAAVLEDGRHITTRTLVLATGVRDELPAIEGLADLWGRSVFHCPY